jgi:hypothetical protein
MKEQPPPVEITEETALADAGSEPSDDEDAIPERAARQPLERSRSSGGWRASVAATQPVRVLPPAPAWMEKPLKPPGRRAS